MDIEVNDTDKQIVYVWTGSRILEVPLNTIVLKMTLMEWGTYKIVYTFKYGGVTHTVKELFTTINSLIEYLENKYGKYAKLTSQETDNLVAENARLKAEIDSMHPKFLGTRMYYIAVDSKKVIQTEKLVEFFYNNNIECGSPTSSKYRSEDGRYFYTKELYKTYGEAYNAKKGK